MIDEKEEKKMLIFFFGYKNKIKKEIHLILLFLSILYNDSDMTFAMSSTVCVVIENIIFPAFFL